MKNDFNSFFENYKPIRNPFVLTSPLENMLFESCEEEQLEFVEGHSNDLIWSFTNNGELKNGISYKNIIGYVITTIPFTEKKYGSLTYKI